MRIGLAADVLQVVDVLEQPTVRAHRVAHAGRERTPRRLVGQRERRVEQRHRLAVDDVPVAGGRDTERFEHLAVGDAAQRVTEREPARGRHRVGEVQRLGVDARRRSRARPAGRARRGASASGGDAASGRRCRRAPACPGAAARPRPRRCTAAGRSPPAARVSTIRARCRDPDAAIGASASATGSPNVWTTAGSGGRRRPAGNPRPTRWRDVSQSVVNVPRPPSVPLDQG